MTQSIYIFRGQQVIKTGLTAHKKGRNGNIIKEIFQIKPLDGRIDWDIWVSDSDLYTLTTTGQSQSQ